MVELTSLLLVDPVDYHDELAIAVPPAVLLAHYPSITVFSLIHGFGLSLALVFAEDCMDGLLIGGVACHKVEQLPCRSWFVTSELMNECFVGRAEDECSDHVHIHDIRKLIVLLGKVVNVLM